MTDGTLVQILIVFLESQKRYCIIRSTDPQQILYQVADVGQRNTNV